MATDVPARARVALSFDEERKQAGYQQNRANSTKRRASTGRNFDAVAWQTACRLRSIWHSANCPDARFHPHARALKSPKRAAAVVGSQEKFRLMIVARGGWRVDSNRGQSVGSLNDISGHDDSGIP
jgi:hypothetical protein